MLRLKRFDRGLQHRLGLPVPHLKLHILLLHQLQLPLERIPWKPFQVKRFLIFLFVRFLRTFIMAFSLAISAIFMLFGR